MSPGQSQRGEILIPDTGTEQTQKIISYLQTETSHTVTSSTTPDDLSYPLNRNDIDAVITYSNDSDTLREIQAQLAERPKVIPFIICTQARYQTLDRLFEENTHTHYVRVVPHQPDSLEQETARTIRQALTLRQNAVQPANLSTPTAPDTLLRRLTTEILESPTRSELFTTLIETADSAAGLEFFPGG